MVVVPCTFSRAQTCHHSRKKKFPLVEEGTRAQLCNAKISNSKWVQYLVQLQIFIFNSKCSKNYRQGIAHVFMCLYTNYRQRGGEYFTLEKFIIFNEKETNLHIPNKIDTKLKTPTLSKKFAPATRQSISSSLSRLIPSFSLNRSANLYAPPPVAFKWMSN